MDYFLVLLVAHVLHPLGNLAISFFLNRDVRHCRRWCSAVRGWIENSNLAKLHDNERQIIGERAIPPSSDTV
jgi:hypothetical protein